MSRIVFFVLLALAIYLVWRLLAEKAPATPGERLKRCPAADGELRDLRPARSPRRGTYTKRALLLLRRASPGNATNTRMMRRTTLLRTE